MLDMRQLPGGAWAIGVPDGEDFVVVSTGATAQETMEAFEDLFDEFKDAVIEAAFAGVYARKPKRAKLTSIKKEEPVQ